MPNLDTSIRLAEFRTMTEEELLIGRKIPRHLGQCDIY